MKKFIVDIINIDNQKYHGVKIKIKENYEIITTSHLSLVNHAWENDYEIFIYNGFQYFNIRDLTVKELRKSHNILKLIQSNRFHRSGIEF